MQKCLPASALCAALAGALLVVLAPSAALADPLAAELTYPVSGAKVTDLSQPFQWTQVASAQSYFLVIGTVAGRADVWVSTESTQTAVRVPAILPVGRLLYARVWTKVHGILRRSSDVSFTVVAPTPTPASTPTPTPASTPTFTPMSTPPAGPPSRTVVSGPLLSPSQREAMATMVYPAPDDFDVNFWQPFSWTAVAGAQTYQLLVGTAPGLGDVFDSGETHWTSSWLPLLPPGSYYGRVATNVAGRWAFHDFRFGSSGYPAATIRSPANGSILDAGQITFAWDAIPNATAYRLVVGTNFGESDIADSGDITESSFEVPSIPFYGPAYVRLFTNKWGAWRHTDVVLSTGPVILPTLVTPLDGAKAVNTGIPFEWKPTVLASAYRLEIGTSPGEHDLHDSDEITVPKRFVGSLPLGKTLYGRVSAHIGGAWVPVDFRFTVGSNAAADPYVVPAALWATDFVREMADEQNVPFPGTPLARVVAAQSRASAFCTDYTTVLLSSLWEMNVTAPARYLNVCLKPNSYDGHTLVELQEPLGGTWMILDPTFDLTVRRAADGQWATASDVSQATKAMRFSDVTYDFLGAWGNYFAKGYYIDYPLLYLVVCPSAGCPDRGPTSLPYMEPVPMPVGTEGLYAIQGPPGGQVGALVNGAGALFDCDPVDGLTYVFGARSIDPVPGFTIQAFRPRRFVF